ncbi:DUF3905 domain-containing protein [Paenibacillus cremeus]|uniref:DUF3905 domain-containing protein n=1 Tax=Paenibacillus cremeus TaxID=2163881 RepID=A0A559KDM2_9BACL|nr:DUF3905 domain-containing protein [Paenibacillus cremeus]TVY10203.1 DUF3905 domain-containing protein [Paenibacillus cremeus]
MPDDQNQANQNQDSSAYEQVDTNNNYNQKNDAKLDPFEINFRPEFKQGRGPQEPFVNEHGVLIGDHEYQSANSPLEQWSKETDPSVMSGDNWVHPYKDVGFQTAENRDLFEQGIAPNPSHFMHSDKDVSYNTEIGEANKDSAESKDS